MFNQISFAWFDNPHHLLMQEQSDLKNCQSNPQSKTKESCFTEDNYLKLKER